MYKKKFIKKKINLIKINSTPKGFGLFKFVWILKYNQKDYLRNRNKIFLIKNFFNGKISFKQQSNFIKNYAIKPRMDFIIIKKSNRKMIGCLNLNLKNKEFHLGKFISDKKYLSKGLMKKAFKNFINFILKNFNIEKIVAFTKTQNKRNISFNLKNGFEIVKIRNGITKMKLNLRK